MQFHYDTTLSSNVKFLIIYISHHLLIKFLKYTAWESLRNNTWTHLPNVTIFWIFFRHLYISFRHIIIRYLSLCHFYKIRAEKKNAKKPQNVRANNFDVTKLTKICETRGGVACGILRTTLVIGSAILIRGRASGRERWTPSREERRHGWSV